MNYWDKRYRVISDPLVWDGDADWKWLFSSRFHLAMPVFFSSSEHKSADQDIFCSGTVSPKCCVHSTWETITPDRKSLMKPLNKSKVCDFIKSCLCVYFSSRGPGHPCLKELCFKLFPFEFLSFGFYSFYFQPSCISNKFKRPFLFCDSDYNNFHSSSISAYI